MPRLVLKDGMERRRCNVACDSCRKRKEKCDSRQPCAGCVKRGIECVFVPPSASSDVPPAKRRKSKTEQDHEPTLIVNDIMSNAGSISNLPSATGHGRRSSTATDAPSFLSNGIPSPRSPTIDTFEVPVPHMLRLFREQRGSVIYVGGSASLSFLQNVQHVVFSAIGECDFVTEPLLQSFLDVPPMARDDAQLFDRINSNASSKGLPMLTLEQADMLAHQYLIATSALLDLFDTTTIFRSTQAWLEGNTSSELCRPVVYLIMAIGASVTATNGWDEIAERYFNAGRQLALDSLTMEPSLDTIQAFVLMTMYMIGTTQPNAAFVVLGTAIRTAYTIGLHQSDLQNTFSEAEKQSRECVWRSLRALDLFLSTALGRPCATSSGDRDQDIIDTPSSMSAFSGHGSGVNYSMPSPAITGLCSIFEQILTDVYKQQAVSIRVAGEITRLYRQLSARLPHACGSIPFDAGYPATYADLAKRVATARVMSTYHWSIILLARPFLTAHVTGHVQQAKGVAAQTTSSTHMASGSTVASYAEFGVDSAVSSLDIAAELLRIPGLPRRLPFVTESIFNAALTVGVAFFGDFDKTYPLLDAMSTAQNLLSHLSTFDCQARRFQQFVATLSEAARLYIEQRDRSSVQDRQMRKHSIFGIVGADAQTTFTPTPTPYSPNLFAPTNVPTHNPATFSLATKLSVGDWNRATSTRLAPQGLPSPPDAGYHNNGGFHIPDMVPTPPDSRSSDEHLSSAMLDHPNLEYFFHVAGSDFMTAETVAAMSQDYQSEFHLLASDMSNDVDCLPMYDALGEPILF